MNTEVETVTPEAAAALIQRSEKAALTQRSLSEKHVRGLAKIMKAGNWRVNGESIKLSSDGGIVDGQHRLHAVVRAGVPIDIYVIRGIDPQVFDSIDRGKMRSFADILGISGEVNARVLGTAAGWLVAYIDRQMLARFTRSPQEIIDCVEEYPGLRDSVEISTHFRKHGKLVSSGLLSFCHLVFGAQDTKNPTDFFQALYEGTGLERGDPILVLRDRLQVNSGKRIGRLQSIDILALTFKAWRMHEQGQRFTKTTKGYVLGWRRGKRGEDFPYLNDALSVLASG